MIRKKEHCSAITFFLFFFGHAVIKLNNWKILGQHLTINGSSFLTRETGRFEVQRLYVSNRDGAYCSLYKSNPWQHAECKNHTGLANSISTSACNVVGGSFICNVETKTED